MIKNKHIIVDEIKDVLTKLHELQADEDLLSGYRRRDFLNKQMYYAKDDYEEMSEEQLIEYLTHKKFVFNKKLQNNSDPARKPNYCRPPL